MRARVAGVVMVGVATLAACGGASHDAPSPSAAPHGRGSTPSATPAPAGGILAEYSATFDPSEGEIAIEARFDASAGTAFIVDRGADAFVKSATAAPDRDGAAFAPMVHDGRTFTAAACARAACRVRYRFALKTAGRRLDDVDIASEDSDVLEAPPSTWLLVPSDAPRDALARFRVKTPEGTRFVTGVFHSKDAPDAWDITFDDLWTAPYSAFGALRVRTIATKDAKIELAIGPGKLAVTDEQIATWTTNAARSIEAYFGRFPMPTALVLVVPGGGPGVGSGKTLAGGGGTVWIRVGERASQRAFDRDWVLVHEMTHLTFPSVTRGQEWAEEGLATYVEPFARARAGLLSPEEAWRGLIEGLPNGLPGPNDRGLDNTRTWGRTYWGGALFYFLADVEIRKRTQNRFGLEHALRGILAAGGTNAVRWPLDTALTTGDKATGVPVLRELHEAMGASPHPVDLAKIGAELGVAVMNGKVVFDDKAPFANVRHAITTGEP